MPIYAESTHLIGSIEEPTSFDVPGFFGDVLTLIATLSTTGGAEAAGQDAYPGPTCYVWWHLEDSLDGDHFTLLAGPGDTGYRLLGSEPPAFVCPAPCPARRAA